MNLKIDFTNYFKDKFMKKLFVYILFFFLLIPHNIIYAQSNPLSYKEFKKLDKKLDGSISYYLFSYFLSNYSNNLDFSTDIDEFFNFNDDDGQFIPLLIQQVLQANKQAFQIKQTDSNCYIYYDGHCIMGLSPPLSCDAITIRMRNMVKMYDLNGDCIYNEIYIDSFRNELSKVYKVCKCRNFVRVPFTKDTTYSYFSIVIPYQYDTTNGLTIHKICSQDYMFTTNYYTQLLYSLAEDFCKKYNLSKIIFTALLLKENE